MTDELKYERGDSSQLGRRKTTSPLEWLTLAHVSIFVIATSWAFGGQADWLQTPLSLWGTAGLLITLIALGNRKAGRSGTMQPLWWLLPLAGFNAVVLLASFNPSFREIRHGAEVLLLNAGGHRWLPSSARPELALRALWLFDAIWISCFNLAFVVQQRRALRLLLIIVAANGLVLAVFGTAQKLMSSPGLFFGTVPSPQTAFFASFVYHNHWGAFTLLMLAICLALTWHFGRRSAGRNFLHTPATLGIVVLVLLAATIPLSTSRSGSLLATGLLGGAFLHAVARIVQRRRRFNESIAPPLMSACAAVAVAASGIWWIAREPIAARVAKTREQVAEMHAQGSIGDRMVLYGNTWRMAKEKLWFGWGMASYPHVFTLFNTRTSPDRLPVFYRDAHNDWLQALAEHGVIGSLLLAWCALMPLRHLRWRMVESPIPTYLFGGCALLLVYAAMEFPFGNIAVVLTWWLCFFVAVQYSRLHDSALPDRETVTRA